MHGRANHLKVIFLCLLLYLQVSQKLDVHNQIHQYTQIPKNQETKNDLFNIKEIKSRETNHVD
uniref:Uncharacterized protein n=1 Tax=Rhizophora mucronata TaxID=61149 RepID=A0A2P2PMZ6_RHIMU